MKLPPFAHIGGRDYLVVNFDLPPPEHDPQFLVDHVEQLLAAGYGPQDIVLLRPLSQGEARMLRRMSREAATETWAQIVVHPGDRWVPRIK